VRCRELTACLIALAVLIASCAGDDEGTQNASPVIDDLIVPEAAETGANVSLRVATHDPDGDSLTYVWKIDGDPLGIDSPTAAWSAPQSAGPVTVTVSVRGGISAPVARGAAIAIQSPRAIGPPAPVGIVTYSYGPLLRKALHSPSMYARISLTVQNRFSSKHALALCELCVHWRRRESGTGETPWIPTPKLRELMGSPEDQYTDFRRLNQRVIKGPTEELNESTDLLVRAEFRRANRRVVAIRLRIWTQIEVKQAPDRQKQLFAAGEIPDIVLDLTKAGLPEDEAHEIWEQGWNCVNADKRSHRDDFVAYVREKIALLDARPPGTVRNRVGFLIEAIRANYTDPQIEAAASSHKQQAMAQQRQRLTEQRVDMEQRRDIANHKVRLRLIAEDARLLDDALATVLEETPTNRMFVDREKDAAENYTAAAGLAAIVDAHLMARFPKRLASAKSRYGAQIRKIDEQIAALFHDWASPNLWARHRPAARIRGPRAHRSPGQAAGCGSSLRIQLREDQCVCPSGLHRGDPA
jgi:hypothetical protein